MKWNLYCLSLIIILASCAPFQDSPFSDQLLRSERDLNTQALQRLQDPEADGVIRLAIFADSHNNYEDLDGVIRRINREKDLDFVVNLGDFTNNAYNFEYNQFLDSHVLIRRPTFTVIGNHDAIGAGPSLFEKAFGPSNFIFESDNKRFIFFHSVNWEDPRGFSSGWLKQMVDTSTKPVVIFTHVPLRDEERYSGSDAQNFSDVIQSPKTQLILNGHRHVYNLAEENGTILLQAPRVQHLQWMIIEIQGTQLRIHRKDTGEVQSATLKP